MRQTGTENTKNKKEKSWQRALAGGLLLFVCILGGGIAAKYFYQSITDPGQAIAENFYFTADLLGDTKMVPADGEESSTYSFGEASTEGSWYLYGAGKHEIKIQVQNYYDELRTTEKEITYTAEISVKKADGTSIQTDGSGLQLLGEDGNSISGGTLTGKVQSVQTVTLSIPAYTDWNYEDGTDVTVKLKSSTPYSKTLTSHFTLYATDTTLKYEVIDSVGSPYAELILMTNIDGTVGVQPYLSWPDDLSIDNTNSLTFAYKAGIFTQQTEMTDRNMQISEDLKIGRSESIYFFKADPTKDYSCGKTIVNPENNKYTINIGTQK